MRLALPFTVPLALILSLACQSVGAIVLYQPGLAQVPPDQGWLLYGSDGLFSGGNASQAATATGTLLTTDSVISAGYSNTLPIINQRWNPAFPTLDRNQGFSLGFAMALLSESHIGNDRAGFSVTLLSGDAVGIELGFWQDRVWAQEIGFTHAEESAGFTPQGTNAIDYLLTVMGNAYQLFADGNPILGGMLRNYGTPSAPYGLGDFLFLGDNTGSAAASVELGLITLDLHSVPIADSISLFLIGIAAASATRTRTRNGR